jgi:uncharacterized damage-inducible protein DinB
VYKFHLLFWLARQQARKQRKLRKVGPFAGKIPRLLVAVFTQISFSSCVKGANLTNSKATAMKQFYRFFTLTVLVGMSSFLHAQNANESLVKEWERAKAYTKEYLDAMPADKYGYKPTPEMRSFAEQMLHLTEANYGIGAVAAGINSPVAFGALEKQEDKSKAAVDKVVMDGYDFVINALKNMEPAQMSEMIKLFGRYDASRAQAFEKCFEHQTHHRGQTTVYIRLAGAKPPQEKLF